MVDGLWQKGSALAADFATVVYRQQLLGFNAVRLPFSFQDLLTLKPQDFVQPCTPPTAEQVAGSVTAPGTTAPGQIPAQPAPPSRPTGACNEYLPSDSVFNRYVWVVRFYAHNGFYVVLNNHLREDQTAVTNPNQWADNWAKLMAALAQDPVTKSHIFVDLLEEPDNNGLTWEGSTGKPALKTLYLSAMDAITAVAPDTVFLLEGSGQSGIGANWGDGFATNAGLIAQQGLSDPRPFLDALAGKPYANQVVIAPHVYGPAVTGTTDGSSGAALWTRLTESFGYLTKAGYNGKTFPVALGEFGSTFVQQNDVQTLKDLVSYLTNSGSANDGKHNPIDSWFYWAWNANSGSTGGLVQDDWQTLQWEKIALLNSLGLTAFAASPAPPLPPAPEPAPVPTPTPVPLTCTVTVNTATWKNGSAWQGTVDMQVKNTGNHDIQAPWKLTVGNAQYGDVVQAWNWKVQSGAGMITGTASETWQVLKAHGGSAADVGFVVNSSVNNVMPDSAALNGAPCTVSGT